MAASKKQTPVAKAAEPAKVPARPRTMEDFERLFEELMRVPWVSPMLSRLQEWRPVLEGAAPKLDVVDRDNEIVVRAEVPGFKKQEIEISVSGYVFTVKGQTKHEEKEEKGDYHRAEISQSSFSRSVTLPAEVRESGAKAQMRDGILEVTLPKVEKAKKRAITIE